MVKATDKFIRVRSGAVYHHTDLLARRKDAVIVGPQEFADYLRECGVANDVTRKYPTRDTAEPKKKSRGRPAKPKETAIKEPETADLEDALSGDALEEVLRNAKDVR